MLNRPEEIYSVQEAYQERRIAERRQRPADIGNEDDKEHDDVDPLRPSLIGAQQWPDQDHARARGTDDARQDCADRQYKSVRGGCRTDVPGYHYSARDRIKRK